MDNVARPDVFPWMAQKHSIKGDDQGRLISKKPRTESTERTNRL